MKPDRTSCHLSIACLAALVATSAALAQEPAVAASVAAASIIAKVTRDRIMVDYAAEFPTYQFDVHKGYCTALHQSELDEQGPCAIHRQAWDNVARTTKLKRS